MDNIKHEKTHEKVGIDFTTLNNELNSVDVPLECHRSFIMFQLHAQAYFIIFKDMLTDFACSYARTIFSSPV